MVLFTALFAEFILNCGDYSVYLPLILRRMKKYIYQQSDWPAFNWDNKSILYPLSDVRHLQGKLVGKMEALGFKDIGDRRPDTGP
jgi:hypothetical protein